MPLDDADKKFIAESIAAGVTAGIAEQTKATEALVGKAVKAATEPLTKQFGEFKTATEKRFEEIPKPKDDGADPKNGKQDAGGDIEKNPAFMKLKADLEASQKTAADSAAKAKAAEDARAANHLRQSLRDSLVQGGADAKRIDFALDRLISTGAVKLNDKGEPVWPTQQSWGVEDVAVAAGAKKWLGTDDGKFFVPPVNTRGTGDGAGNGSGANGEAIDPMKVALDAFES